MKKNNKLSQGMTLVEVIVAMTIFAVMAATITSVIVHANLLSNRAKMRDVELATETNIIGRNKSKTRDEIHVFNPYDGYTGDFKIVFNENGTTKIVDNVQVYETNQGRFDDAFGFQLKTVIPASSLTGLPLTNLSDDEYRITFKNTLAESIIVTLEIADGYLFEGNGQKYVHTTRSHVKTIPAGSTADIGFYCDHDAEVHISFDTGIASASLNGLRASASFPTTALDSDVRSIEYAIHSSGGTNPTFGVTQTILD